MTENYCKLNQMVTPITVAVADVDGENQYIPQDLYVAFDPVNVFSYVC